MITTTPGRDERAGAQWFKELHEPPLFGISLSGSSSAASSANAFGEPEPEPEFWAKVVTALFLAWVKFNRLP